MATLNVIDISSWQKGLDLSSLFSQNPTLNGVIVKATGGVSNVQPTCDAWAQWLMQNNKPWGFYHFLDDDYQHSSGAVEARFFVDNTKNYFKHGIPVADYETPATSKGTGYLKDFLDTVYLLTGVRPLVYCSLSVVQSGDFQAIARAGYQLWVAQYADMNTVNGFVDTPWQKGSVSPFSGYVMHQYTSCGRLNGWGGNLDFDKFYGSVADWNAIANGDKSTPETVPEKKKVNSAVVMDVLNGKYGIREDRVKRLKADGFNPDEVQAKINELYTVAGKVKPLVASNMSYLDCIVKIIRSL